MSADNFIKTLSTQKHVIFIQQLNLIDILNRLARIKKEDHDDSE